MFWLNCGGGTLRPVAIGSQLVLVGFGWEDNQLIPTLDHWSEGPEGEKSAIGPAEGGTCPGVENIPETSVGRENLWKFLILLPQKAKRKNGKQLDPEQYLVVLILSNDNQHWYYQSNYHAGRSTKIQWDAHLCWRERALRSS